MKSAKQLRAIHASKKVSDRRNPSIKYHPDLAKAREGWNFSARNHGIMFYNSKKEAEEKRELYKDMGVQVSKIRNGRRRKIDSSYGFQGRYQESTGGRLPKSAIGKDDVTKHMRKNFK